MHTHTINVNEWHKFASDFEVTDLLSKPVLTNVFRQANRGGDADDDAAEFVFAEFICALQLCAQLVPCGSGVQKGLKVRLSFSLSLSLPLPFPPFPSLSLSPSLPFPPFSSLSVSLPPLYLPVSTVCLTLN